MKIRPLLKNEENGRKQEKTKEKLYGNKINGDYHNSLILIFFHNLR